MTTPTTTKKMTVADALGMLRHHITGLQGGATLTPERSQRLAKDLTECLRVFTQMAARSVAAIGEGMDDPAVSDASATLAALTKLQALFIPEEKA